MEGVVFRKNKSGWRKPVWNSKLIDVILVEIQNEDTQFEIWNWDLEDVKQSNRVIRLDSG